MKLGRNKHQGQAQIDWINAKLEYSEKSGFTIDSKEHILKQSKSLLYDFNPNSENIISDHNWSNKMKKWKTFAKRIVINKSMETVYRCWATKGQIETWFLEKAQFTIGNNHRQPNELIQKGDHFVWKWNNWDYSEEGEILEANGKDVISFTFGAGGNVKVSLKEVDGGTEVTLVQDDIPTDEEGKMSYYVGCSTGWTFWLTNLKAYLEHNITLHATGLNQEETKNLVNS